MISYANVLQYWTGLPACQLARVRIHTLPNITFVLSPTTYYKICADQLGTTEWVTEYRLIDTVISRLTAMVPVVSSPKINYAISKLFCYGKSRCHAIPYEEKYIPHQLWYEGFRSPRWCSSTALSTSLASCAHRH